MAVAVAEAVVVGRNGIARERMVVADLSRALDATASILDCEPPPGRLARGNWCGER